MMDHDFDATHGEEPRLEPHREAPPLERDARLGALLLDAQGADDPAWDALHAAIVRRAALPLARLRAVGSAARREEMEWWELAARWARAALPLAVAAGIMLVLSFSRMREASAQSATAPSVRAALVRVVASADENGDLLHALLGSGGKDAWVIQGALDRE